MSSFVAESSKSILGYTVVSSTKGYISENLQECAFLEYGSRVHKPVDVSFLI